MKPMIKIFTTLSLSAAIGEKVLNDGPKSTEIAKAALELKNAGYKASAVYPYQGLSGKKVTQVLGAVDRLLNKQMAPGHIISIMIAGLVDIYSKVGVERKKLLTPVIKALENLLSALDDHTDYDQSYIDYLAWLEDD